MIPIRDKNPTKTFPYVTIFLIILNILIYFFPTFSHNTTVVRLYTYYKHGVIPGLFQAQTNRDKHEEIWQELKTKSLQPPIPFGKRVRQYQQELFHWKAMETVFRWFEEEGGHKARFELATLFTSMFLHGGILHLLGNMLFLWIFGNNIEDACGHLKFVIFYLSCGLAASFVHLAVSSGSLVPTIGASGAISGILGAYLLLYPKAEILTLVPIYPFMYPIELPAAAFLIYWIALQFISGLPSLGRIGGGVAWFAHIGGFFAGLILIIILKKRQIKFFN